MTYESEILAEISQSKSSEDIINEVRALRNAPDRWEVSLKLKALAPSISKLPDSDKLSIVSFIKQTLYLKNDDIKAINIEINKYSHKNLLKKYDIELDLDAHGSVRATDKNLISIFKTDQEICHCFKKNMFSNEIDVPHGGQWFIQDENFPRTIKNSDLNQLKLYIITKYNVEFKIPQIDEAVHTIAIINHYDPLIEYLDPLKWDGVERLESWLSENCGAIDNAYTRWVGKTMLTAAVARAYVPGIKYDHVVILAGDQAVQKSTLIETLAGKQFFNEITLADNERDTIQKMQGSWIIELPEGMPFGTKEINSFKNFVTSKKNKERFAYERHAEIYQRRSIFIMTINPTDKGYLPDETGNRRFLPVRIKGEINIPKIKQIRDQLFAEAKHLFKSGYPIHLDKSDTSIIEGMSEEHSIAETQDDWNNTIIMWLSGRTCNIKLIPEFITCLDVWTMCLDGKKENYEQRKQGGRIGKILRKLGMNYTSHKDGSVVIKGFKTSEIINKLRSNPVEQAQEILNENDQYDF